MVRTVPHGVAQASLLGGHSGSTSQRGDLQAPPRRMSQGRLRTKGTADGIRLDRSEARPGNSART